MARRATDGRHMQAATDLIALLSVTNSPEGGHSKWVSGIAIRNELLRRGRKVLHARARCTRPEYDKAASSPDACFCTC